MADDARIRQFEKMANDDPNNELGHFSLGKAYFEAGRFMQASASLKRALDLNPTLSKAYELLGVALEKSGQRDLAIEMVTRGVMVADERGDRKPREAMIELLKSWGAPLPQLKSAASGVAAPGAGATGLASGGASGFACSRCGRTTGKMERAPFKGPLGQKILDHVCQTCWREWIPMGTKVINELGLQLANRAHEATYDQYMVEFLQLDH